MAEAIKKIAGDEKFTSNPTRTLKTITDTINGLGETYYKKTDTVNEAKHATNADEAKHATNADTANIATQNVKKSGDTMTGILKIIGLSSGPLDLDRFSKNKIGYNGLTIGTCDGYNIWGQQYWGTGAIFSWNTGNSDSRVLGTQLYFANSDGAYIRFDTNSNKPTEWQRLAT